MNDLDIQDAFEERSCSFLNTEGREKKPFKKQNEILACNIFKNDLLKF